MEDKNQMEMLEMKNTIPKMKNSLDCLNSRLDTNEEKLCELEGRSKEVSKLKDQEKKTKGCKQSIQYLPNNVK